MTGFTPEQWALIIGGLLLALILGVFLGANPKWKRRYREEHTRYQALERDHEARIRAANARIAELERDRPVDRDVAPATTDGKRGDDLSEIRGITTADAAALNEMGYTRFKHLAKLNAEKRAEIEGRLGADPGMIEREAWQEQAALLSKGNIEEHGRLYRGNRE